MQKRLKLCFLFIVIALAIVNNWQCKSRTKSLHPPKLVIGIVVDQMRYDYLYRYYNKWSEGGFKRLLTQGFSFYNAEYNYVPTYTAPGHTSIYTGTTPSVHGIIGNNWYDCTLHRNVYCTEDSTVTTIGSTSGKGNMSPRREQVETIGDALKLSNNGQSKVIGISLKDRAAILPAGHWANAAYWFDDATGNWITSSYYMKELPEWVKKFNSEQKAGQYLSRPWNTLLPIAEYTESIGDNNPYEKPFIDEQTPTFPHNLPKLLHHNGGYGLIKATPFGNDITKDFAIAAIENEKLGKGNATDMLTISFSSTDYIGHQFGTTAIETEDTYLRLDKNISELLTFLDNYIGKENVVVFLTADHGSAINANYLTAHNIPAGYVDKNTLLSGIKTYMNQKYGIYPVLQFINLQFYLDKEKIMQKGLNIDTIEEEIARLSLTVKGIERAIPAYCLNSAVQDFVTVKINNGYYPSRSGNVILSLSPNYLMYDTTGTTHGSPYTYDAHVPLIFYGECIPHGSCATKENITAIAPTIACLLHIACPNGCTGHNMPFAIKQ